jgi:hypothetical protein
VHRPAVWFEIDRVEVDGCWRVYERVKVGASRFWSARTAAAIARPIDVPLTAVLRGLDAAVGSGLTEG